jgi:diaminopimelate epimerase
MTQHFIKMNGLGNDFVIFDARKKSLRLSRAEVKAIADRRFGVGCDQVIVIEKGKKARACMRIFNADGGEVSSCGNATRCVAWLLMEETGKKEISLETKAGVLACKRIGKMLIAADMGKPGLEWKQIPLKYKCDTMDLPINLRGSKAPSAVSMGNPHMVFIVPNVDAVPVKEAGSKLEHHPLFPERANISFAQILSKSRIKLRVWERGAGETLACGTAACAALVALCRKGLVGNHAEVILPGGVLDIEWNKKTGHVWMTGSVAVSFNGEIKL